MACENCLIDLDSSEVWEDAKEPELYWEMRELGPRRGSYQEEEKWRNLALIPLLELHADREKVISALGLDFVDLSVDSSQRQELNKWLFFDEVIRAARLYPGILFHIGPSAMTWLFFDSENRLRDCFIRPT